MEKKEILKVVGMVDVSKSKRMLMLYEKGLKIGEIADLMGVRYNFVYNVVSNDCLKKGVEMGGKKENNVSKKGDILQLLEEGFSIKDVCLKLKLSYNYVFGVRKEKELKEKLLKEIEKERENEI